MTKFSASQQSQLAQIGAFLRDHREKQEKSLEDIALRTYIRPQLLNGLEAGNPDVLPEPIFVQGFIRRYAEVLGLNGVELSQQFTVDSIPSTPRPARPAPPTDSPTTRLTRLTPPQPASQPVTQPVTPQPLPSLATPMVSAESSSTPEQPAAVEVAAELAGDSEKANIPDVEEPVLADLDSSPSAAAVPQPSEPAFATIDTVFLPSQFSTSETSIRNFSTTDFLESETAAYENTHTDVQLQEQPNAISSETSLMASPSDLGGRDSSGNGLDGDGANHLNGDRNPNSLHLDPEEPPTGSSDSAAPIQFDDDELLPEAFTAQAAPPVMPPAANSTEPVGVDYSHLKSTNLMPFIIGGLAVVVAAGAAILFALVGGGDRQPSIANRPDAVEQTIDTAPPNVSEAPAAPEEAVSAQPPVSTAPVYVEAIATSEAWVSIIADGNPTPIFEGTLQPGERQVWEAQEELSVYAGDPGALKLSANGAEATVMGKRGQPTEKIFP